MVRRWHAELAWLPGTGLERDVLIEASDDRFISVVPEAEPSAASRLAGLTLPGFANAHSHAFHRALRATTGGSDFWDWRSRMYEVASRLDPDSHYRLARAVYAEMALAGIACVGEFHYLHAGSNSHGHRLIEAAGDAGLRITLLDACYLTAGPAGEPVTGAQRLFSDGSADRWASRLSGFGPVPAYANLGAAVHSVRAVPASAIPAIVAWAHAGTAPLHAHLSEQPAENAACLEAYGRTPAQVFEDVGVLGPRTTMVHATHLTQTDVHLLGESQTTACLCPTTEADLGDGIGPAAALSAAGSPLSLGTDSHAVIDMLQEARWLEWGQRLATGRRGILPAESLAVAATAAGHACLGWPDAGEIVPGAYADLVTVGLDTVRLAGAGRHAPLAPLAPLAAVIGGGTAADIRNVVISGRDVVRDGRHLLVEDVPGELSAAISAVLP